MRFTVCTYNLWGSHRWDERRAALVAFLQKHRPDILCVQELRPAISECILETIPEYETVLDPFAGWRMEGNVFWNRELFDHVEHRAVDVGIEEELRRLFCVRLRPKLSENGAEPPTLHVATVHYTWRETPGESAGGPSPRLEQARRTVTHLSGEVQQDEASILLGDLNDSMHALRILLAGGYRELFDSLGLQPVPTWPVMSIESGIPELDDWILFRGPLNPMLAAVPDFLENGKPPSDHRPVLACFRLAV